MQYFYSLKYRKFPTKRIILISMHSFFLSLSPSEPWLSFGCIYLTYTHPAATVSASTDSEAASRQVEYGTHNRLNNRLLLGTNPQNKQLKRAFNNEGILLLYANLKGSHMLDIIPIFLFGVSLPSVLFQLLVSTDHNTPLDGQARTLRAGIHYETGQQEPYLVYKKWPNVGTGIRVYPRGPKKSLQTP